MRLLLTITLIAALAWFVLRKFQKQPDPLKDHLDDDMERRALGRIATRTEIGITPPISTVGRLPLAEAVYANTMQIPNPREYVEYQPTANGLFSDVYPVDINDLLVSWAGGSPPAGQRTARYNDLLP